MHPAEHHYEAPLPNTTPTPSPAVPPQIQFRSYQHDIQIYHIHIHILPLRRVRHLMRAHPDYTATLTGSDPLQHAVRTEGDEIPFGSIEAAYLPGVFHGAGSALGVRVWRGARGRVEWFCFRGPVEGFLKEVGADRAITDERDGSGDGERVFDLVGFVQKGLRERRVKGANWEHKAWHDSLRCAERKKVRVDIGWRKRGEGVLAEGEGERRERVGERSVAAGVE
jgi:hypothetical protein